MTNRREDQGNAAIADIKKDFPDAKASSLLVPKDSICLFLE